MRTENEISRMHDLLHPIIMGEVPHPCPHEARTLQAVLEVLCWTLHHEPGAAFEKNMKRIEQWLKDQGFDLSKTPQNPKAN